MPPSVQARPFTGIALKVVSTLVFTAMATLIKLVSARYPVGELTFFRSFFALIPVCAWVGWRKFPGIFRTSRFGGHFVRSIAGATAIVLLGHNWPFGLNVFFGIIAGMTAGATFEWWRERRDVQAVESP